MPQIKLIYMNILFLLVANRCSYYFFIQSYCRDKVPSFLKFSPQKFLDLPPTFLAIAMELIPLIKQQLRLPFLPELFLSLIRTLSRIICPSSIEQPLSRASSVNTGIKNLGEL